MHDWRLSAEVQYAIYAMSLLVVVLLLVRVVVVWFAGKRWTAQHSTNGTVWK